MGGADMKTIVICEAGTPTSRLSHLSFTRAMCGKVCVLVRLHQNIRF